MDRLHYRVICLRLMASKTHCPACSAKVPAESRFCPSCGEAIGGLSDMTTAPLFAAASAAAAAPQPARRISSDSVPVGGFAPGAILPDRYRIIGLLGRGGMGEVYRADDLKLGQAVALKFLPAALASDPVRRERFFAEVRITRQFGAPFLVGTFIAFGYLLLFVLFAMMLRKDWLAIAALVILRALPAIVAGYPWTVAASVVQDGLLLLILLRFGLLGGMTAGIVQGFFLVPLTFQTSAWYSPVGFVALSLVAAISVYAFRTSLATVRRSRFHPAKTRMKFRELA